MVTIIKFGKTLRSPFHYNENKLKEGKAELIHTANYGKDTELLSQRDRIARLEKLAARNEKAQLKSAHITINFHPDEKLDKETLHPVADRYMREIGFGDQPYLVYQHHDAAHPRIHILSTLTRLDGTRIPTHNIGRLKSEPARQLIEREFNLKVAQQTDLRQAWKTLPVDVEKVRYGQTETRRGITVILDSVLPRYHYTSLPELNAILRNYNVMADNGGESSRLRQRGGLVYRVLDDKGNKVGVPIKASAIYSKPTLKFLEKQFALNATLRAEGKPHLKQAIDLALELDRPRNMEELQNALGRQGIDLILRANEKGTVYGMTYVDHRLKNIFNGSDLGKAYSVSGMVERLKSPRPRPAHSQHPKAPLPEAYTIDPREIEKPAITGPALRFDPLAAIQPRIPEEPTEPDPATLKKRKKKRKRLHL
jgi:hypothetical protein